MFSSLKNHTNNLIHSQRFYYNSYEFYNDFQDIEVDAKNDLGKIFFYLKRKSTGKIFSYREQIPEEDFPRKIKGNKLNTMESILYPFLQFFYENNYSDLKPDLPKFKENLQIHYLPLQTTQYTSLTEDQQWDEYSEKLQAEIRHIKNEISQQLGMMEDEDKINQATIRFCLQAFNLYVVKEFIPNRNSKNKTELYYTLLVKYRQFMKSMIENMLDAHSWNILYLAVPNLGNITKIIHPITLGLQAFAQSNHKILQDSNFSKPHLLREPRIVFINLDGKQHYQNIREIKRINSPILYISIYKEPNEGDLNNIIIQQQDDIENFNTISKVLSRKLIEQIKSKNSCSHSSSKILLFPLNSIQLQKQYRKKKQNSPAKEKHAFPKLGTSEDIHFLFEIMIYEEIRSFNPTIILISYNGLLDIKEDQFSEMVRNLTIMADHKILLFPNLSELFEVPSDILPEQEDDEDAFDKFGFYKQFYNKFMNYSLQQISCAVQYQGQNRPKIIDTERFLHNLSMFIKLSSGTYSMKPRIIQNASSKYLMGMRYMYLQILSQFAGFQGIKKYISNKWDCEQLEILFKQYGKAELKENKKQNEFYQGLLENVFNQLFNNCENIPLQALYKLEQLKCEIQNQYEVDRKSSQFMELLKANLIEAKEKLLLENLQTQKHKKIYKVYKESDNNQVKCYTFCMHGDQTGQQLQFDKYTQVIADQSFSMITIVNYKADKQHQILVSNQINTNGQHITVSVVKATQSLKDQCSSTGMQFDHHSITDLNMLVRQNYIYINYSYCYINRVLYLYWPQKWCLQDQIMYKLLNMTYRPPIDKRIVRVYLQNSSNQNNYIYEQVPYNFDASVGTVVPRFGCSSYAYTSDQFFIFGGIYDSKYDFLESCCCINQVKLQNGKLVFKNIPKNDPSSVRLRPKINYTIQAEKGNYMQTTVTNIIISGGYGRQTTNFYNVYSYDSYNFSCDSKTLTLRPQIEKESQKQHLRVRSKQRRVVSMNQPIQINQIGKFPVANDENFLLCDRQAKFVHQPMNKFIFELETRKANSNLDQEQKQYVFASFIEDNYRFNEMKTDYKKIFLFGFNNFIREAIFSKFWSPQLYVLQNLKPFIMQISLKTDKNTSSQKISIPPSLMPIQQDMVSMCLDQDNLYLLTSSPIYAIIPELQKYRHRLILYKGKIQNLRKHDILMEPKLTFSIEKFEYLKAKTIFAIDKSIKIVGGFQQASNDGIHRRNDYILDQTDKQKFKTRTRKVQSPQIDLNRPYPVIVKNEEIYLIYSIIQALTSHEQIDKQQEEVYKLVVQSFTIDEANKQEQVRMSELKFYMTVPDTFKKYRINPSLKQPKLVRISKYKRFSINNFKDTIKKVDIKANKKISQLNNQIGNLQFVLKNSKSEENADNEIRSKRDLIQKKKEKLQFFQSFHKFLSETFRTDLDQKGLQNIQLPLLQNFKKKMHQLASIAQKQQYDKSYENEQFLKELKNCYSIIHKQLIQTILQPGIPKPNEHLFIIEDKGSQKTKYLAIGPLGTTNLNFFKIFFKNELMLCLNETSDECFFYHPTALGCEQIIMDINRYKKERIIDDIQKQEEIMKINIKI